MQRQINGKATEITQATYHSTMLLWHICTNCVLAGGVAK